MIRKISFSILMMFLSVPLLFAEPADSVGLKVRNGKIYIMHQVEKGQGLFTISRTYDVPLTDIIAANPGSDQQIFAGEILFIPTGKDAPMEEKVVKEYFQEERPDGVGTGKPENTEITPSKPTTFAGYHTVEAGETLYQISRKYHTTVEVIRDLNNLENDVLSLGQRLMVPVKTDSEKKDGDTERKEIVAVPSEEPAPKMPSKNAELSNKNYVKTVENIAEFDIEKVREKGFAGMLSGDQANPNKNYCYHHEAEIGTVIMVTNPENQRSVFVKVIENMPFDEEKAIIIQLTPAAASSIKLSTEKSRVEINYAR